MVQGDPPAKKGLFSTIFGCFSNTKQSDEGGATAAKTKEAGPETSSTNEKGKNGLFNKQKVRTKSAEGSAQSNSGAKGPNTGRMLKADANQLPTLQEALHNLQLKYQPEKESTGPGTPGPAPGREESNRGQTTGNSNEDGEASSTRTSEDKGAKGNKDAGRKKVNYIERRVAIVAEMLTSKAPIVKIPKTPEQRHLIETAIEDNILFSMLSLPAREAVISAMYPVHVDPAQEIITQGSLDASKFYVIESGQVEVKVSQEDGSTKVLTSLAAGSTFGELALLYNTPRTATVTSLTKCKLWVLERHVYKYICRSHALHIGQEKEALLDSMPALAKLPPPVKQKLAEALEPVEFEDGEMIFRKGDPSDRFYIVKEGQALITDGDKFLEIIRPGCCFGERSLISGQLRSADSRAQGYVLCYTLHKNQFHEFKAALQMIWKYEALRRVNLLAALTDAQILQIAELMEDRLFKANEVVFRKGDKADAFYVVEDGEFVIFDDDATEFVRLFKGSCFGELALLREDIRTASVMAVTPGKLQRLGRDHFKRLLGNMEEMRLAWRLEALFRVPLLRVLRHDQMLWIARNLEQELLDPGQTVIRYGEAPEKFYIIECGQVEVLDKEGQHITTLGDGSYFGELAFLSKEGKRTASVKTTSPVSLLTFTREQIMEVMPSIKRLLLAEAKNYKVCTPGDLITVPKIGDIARIQILGTGAFGAVWLVKYQDQYYALKQMSKARIRAKGLKSHVYWEKHVMLECNSPFTVNLVETFQDKHYLYLMLEAVMGGELFSYLQSRRYPLTEAHARFYAGCVVLALEMLFSKGYVFRDLKPENILINKDGYLKLSDFGFAKKVKVGRTFTTCGTPDYMAPEMVAQTGHTQAVDLWALGAIVYEMVAGIPPFHHKNPMEVFRRIMQMDYVMPKHISPACQDLIRSLLVKNPLKRLGMGLKGMEELRSHPWFKGFNWQALKAGTMPAPYVPRILNPEDTHNFHKVDPNNPLLKLNAEDEAYVSDGYFDDF